jgi:RNA polymerase sigma-70 factor (ECF subfamily)
LVAHATESPPPAPSSRAEHDTIFRAVYVEHFPFVWRCLRALGVQEFAVADAAQEVFVVVHRRLAEFRGDASLRTWLYAIVRNVAGNQRRGERRRGPTVSLEPEVELAGHDPVQDLEDREAMRFVAEFAMALDEKRRDVFILGLVEGMSMPEVSRILALPLNTAYSRLRSVRLELEKAVARRKARR